MTKKQQRLGNLELEILKIAWQMQPCTVQEVADVMTGRRPCARTTVLTVMQRLHAKGFLRRRKSAGVFRYRTTRQQSKVISGLIGQFVETVLDGSAAPFIAYLTESKKLTEDQIKTLRRMAQDLDDRSREKTS